MSRTMLPSVSCGSWQWEMSWLISSRVRNRQVSWLATIRFMDVLGTWQRTAVRWLQLACQGLTAHAGHELVAAALNARRPRPAAVLPIEPLGLRLVKRPARRNLGPRTRAGTAQATRFLRSLTLPARQTAGAKRKD